MQIAHIFHLIGVYGVYHRACSEEQECLEEGVCKEVKHRCHISQSVVVAILRYAEGCHHIGYLRYCRECQDTFDIGLRDSYDRRKQCRECSDIGYHRKHIGSGEEIYGEKPCYQKDTCNNHSGGVYQCRNGSRTLHGVGQPDMQREHCRFACSAHKYQSQSYRDETHTHKRTSCKRAYHKFCVVGCECSEVECLGVVRQYQYADQEAQVCETRYDKCLFRGEHCRRFLVVEAYERVRRYAYQLPKDVHLEDIRRYHKSQHREAEQRQQGVVTLKAHFAVHISQRVDMHHKRYCGDNHEHHHRDRVEQYAQIDV